MASAKMELDGRVPTSTGEIMGDFRTYEKMVQAHMLSIVAKDLDEREMKLKTVGPALYKNCLVLGNGILMMIEQLDADTLAADDKLLKAPER